MDSISKVIKKLLKSNPKLHQGILEAELLTTWNEEVGPAIAKHTRAYQCKNRTLFVEVDHPIWKQELHANQQKILQKLNLALKKIREKHETPELFPDLEKIFFTLAQSKARSTETPKKLK